VYMNLNYKSLHSTRDCDMWISFFLLFAYPFKLRANMDSSSSY